MDLLNKTRRISRILQKNVGHHLVDFDEVAQAMSDVIASNVYVINPEGKVLGAAVYHESVRDPIQQHLSERTVPADFTRSLMEVDKSMPNVGTDAISLSYAPELKDMFPEGYTTIIPIIGGGDHLGTLVLSRLNEQFVDEDLVLGEYGATVVGMEILRGRAGQVEEEARSRAVVQLAINSLSFSELEAAEHIFNELDGLEGLLVASKIADRVGITRSVIVNALRKLESAGVVESRSLGMKGTYIKILNPKLLPALEKARS
ncbi:transcriptional pleiotropic repressor [Seinonella peptonophila]|uniref:Global transcriptional regulator CodY n=1 Tax=Seinonella peptonophila TaxID=112248 RepID=A0A1M4ZIG9_9BACL|nr:GTP-sensing pleiotropic transcriptional regulator CodY [Seinonella peptonophila]SHF17758.1 transcriptional pleiotropic repressor [Seinonella peptonophila]